jgi:hypothetical protein
MNCFVTSTVGVSKSQDASDSAPSGLVICDGIGSLDDSGIVSNKVCELFIEFINEGRESLSDQSIIDEISAQISSLNILGGTTVIYCRELESNAVRVGYLGNGGITGLRGDFFYEKLGEKVNLYSNILLPHVDKIGALNRHISTNSTTQNIQLSTLDMNLNLECGDILIFYSDGLGSLETQFIADTEENGLWRSELNLFQEVLIALHENLQIQCELEVRSEQLGIMLKRVLTEFKSQGLLEDDISIGLLVTEKVFDYYRLKVSDNG